MKILIWAPSWAGNCGGIIALHRLCYALRMRGADAAMWIEGGGRTTVYDNPVATSVPANCAAIYPEIVSGNPLKAKKVVRWILWHDPGRDRLGHADLTFVYARRFSSPSWPPPAGQDFDKYPELYVFDIQPQYRVEQAAETKREGGCYIVRKGAHKPRVLAIDNSARELSSAETSIDNFGKVTRQHERFYSYDDACFLSLLAPLSGCESIVVPEAGVSGQLWRDTHWAFTVGINYGLDDYWGARTMGGVRNWIEECDRQSIKQVDNLIRQLG